MMSHQNLMCLLGLISIFGDEMKRQGRYNPCEDLLNNLSERVQSEIDRRNAVEIGDRS
jgi:hypothetical protein